MYINPKNAMIPCSPSPPAPSPKGKGEKQLCGVRPVHTVRGWVDLTDGSII